MDRSGMGRAGTYLGVGAVGLVLGLALGRGGEPVVRAGGQDRWADRALVSGAIAEQQNSQKVQISQDAIYYLNYSQGLLLATVPEMRQAGTSKTVLQDFAERDLMADFQLPAGTKPRFLMTVGALGARGEGWSPLYVFETESGQVCVYRLVPQATAGSTRPLFQLLERRQDPRLGRSAALATGAAASPR